MRRFLLDTCMLVHIARNSPLFRQVEHDHHLLAADAFPMISVVSCGEIFSLGQQRGWSLSKMKMVKDFLAKILILDINNSDDRLMSAYAQLDAFSKCKIATNRPQMGARVMGKNDLWIAATACVADAKLITLDGDFDHLHGHFIDVIKYS